jgi:hypothetical protein
MFSEPEISKKENNYPFFFAGENNYPSLTTWFQIIVLT